MPEKYLHIDGVATLLHHTGATCLPEETPDLSRGDPVLCLHGAGGNGAVFAQLLAALEAAHSPLAFDQPGHGRSAGLDSLASIERMGVFALAVADKLGLSRPVLLGHSMGGAVAMSAALDRPDGARALVLVASAAQFSVPDEWVSQLRRVTEGKERRQFRREAYSPATPGDIVRRGFMEDMKTDPRAGYGDLLACRAWDVRARLAEIALPTLVLVGEDELAPLRAQADVLAAEIPGARQVVIPKAGHMVPLEQPEPLAEALIAFLERL